MDNAAMRGKLTSHLDKIDDWAGGSLSYLFEHKDSLDDESKDNLIAHIENLMESLDILGYHMYLGKITIPKELD